MRYFIYLVVLLLLIPIAISAQGIPPDLLKKANAGDAGAQFNLGVSYERGNGVPQDYKKAVEWYLKAANQGYATAQYNLGVMYYEGEGVPQDYTKAAEWFLKAANQGDTEAQYNLGLTHLKGVLGIVDIVTGCAWTYLSKNTQNSNYCDNNLNQAQMTRTLYLMEQLKKENPLIK
jgi:TPR repeat protein